MLYHSKVTLKLNYVYDLILFNYYYLIYLLFNYYLINKNMNLICTCQLLLEVSWLLQIQQTVFQ